MKYFKLINNNTIIGVINDNNFFNYSPISHLLYPTLESNGEYVSYNNKLYRDYWMKTIVTNKYQYENLNILEIQEEEYNQLFQAVIINNEIVEIEEQNFTPLSTIFSGDNNNDNTTLEFIRQSKINEMSHTCNQIIEAGFDIILADNLQHHFSLTTQDQLNLMSLSQMAANGMEAIPYHADGEICKFYSAADISEIVSQATAFKIYHTTYYNALKNYINSLETIEEIAAITYGTILPEEYQSDVLKALTQ